MTEGGESPNCMIMFLTVNSGVESVEGVLGSAER